MFAYGANSRANMAGVHPRLIEYAEATLARSSVDLCVLPGGGSRSRAAAQANHAAGTGVLNSLHIIQRDGYAWAIDLVAIDPATKKPSWDIKLYRAILPASREAAAHCGILIQEGSDWDLDGKYGEAGEWDWPHRQFVVRSDRVKQAQLNLDIMRRALGLPPVKGFVP